MNQRAAAYIRVSTLDQTEFSPDAQLKQIKEYALKHEMYLSTEHIYADEGISGRSTDKRIAFNRMIKNAKKKPRPFDVILIHKFNRFARNREDAIIFKSLLKRDCGIKVISITEPIEDDKIGIIIESVLDAFSEYFSISLSEEVKKGMGEKASRGGVQSRPPFGYDIEDNHLVINRYEAGLVRYIFEKFTDDQLSYIDIARRLNAMGIKTKNGNCFQSKTIKYILVNPTYKGYLLWNKKEKNGAVRNSEDWIIARGNFEPIVPEIAFEKVQERIKLLQLKTKRYSKPSHLYQHYLSGLVLCKTCGGKMVYCNNGKHAYFRCRKAKEGGCNIKKSVRADLLTAEVLMQMDRDWNAVILLVSKYIPGKTEQNNSIYIQQWKSIKHKLELAKQAYLAGADNLTEYQDNKALLLKEKEVVEAYINQESDDKELNEKDTIESFKNISNLLAQSSITLDLKNKAIKSFVKEIVIDIERNSIEIVYDVEDEMF